MRQHFVPRFLLKNFAAGKKREIHVFDKQRENTFRAAISKVAARHGFYDISTGEPPDSLEPGLAALETGSANALKSVIRDETLGSLNARDRLFIAAFTAVQKLRVPTQAEVLKFLNDSVESLIVKSGGDPLAVKNFSPIDKDGARRETLAMLGPTALQVVPMIMSKRWVLYKTTRPHPLYISDNPVVMQNELNRDPIRGTIGFGVPGIEIYLPLTTTLCIAFLCPSVETFFRQVHASSAQPPPSLTNHLRAFSTGMPVLMEPENVTRLNSLQVIYSSRFLYCASDAFELARQMLRDQPRFKGPAMPKVN